MGKGTGKGSLAEDPATQTSGVAPLRGFNQTGHPTVFGAGCWLGWYCLAYWLYAVAPFGPMVGLAPPPPDAHAPHFWKFAAALSATVGLVRWLPTGGVMEHFMFLTLPGNLAFGAAMHRLPADAGTLFGAESFNPGHWFLPLFVFAMLPVLDIFCGADLRVDDQEEQGSLARKWVWRAATLFVVPCCILGTVDAIRYATELDADAETALTSKLGLIFSVALFTGSVGITCAHELSHKHTIVEQLAARIMMCHVSYGHFFVEHVHGHHKMVALDEDPATARYGEPFYSFVPRVLKGEFTSACRLEAARLKKSGLGWWHNEMFIYFGLAALEVGAAYRFWGWSGAWLQGGQGVLAVTLFEAVNYIEHYGLERVDKSELVQHRHSWDADAKLTGALLFKLQRHSDHHVNGGKRYQALQLHEHSPDLPGGYATMVLLAPLTPLWRAVMDPRVRKHRRRAAAAAAKGQEQVYRHGPSPTAEDVVLGSSPSKLKKRN